MDSILDIGFLSPHVAPYIEEHRQECGPLLDVAEELNKIGQRVLAQAKVTIEQPGFGDPKLVTLLLLIRTLSNFQGALLLAERGMVTEARTLARSCYENAYMLSALQKEGAAFVQAMISDDMHARKGQSRWMLDDPARLESVPGGIESMEKLIANIEAEGKAARLRYDQVVERAGIADLYIWYKQLSWDSAHPTVQSLSRYFAEDEGKATISWGPECGPDEVFQAINACLPAVFVAVIVCAEQLGAAEAHLDATKLWERYTQMGRGTIL